MEKWTTAQKKAIESKGSILVTASAGTGKTAVLTEKVASLFLNEGITMNQLLVMTFSSAAAEEMKTRISNKLSELAKDKSIKLNKRRFLFSQIRLLHTANIKTIHAFCNDIIKKYYYEVGLNPNIEVGNTFDIAILKRKAISKVLEQEYKKNEKAFMELLEYFDNSEPVEDIFINSYEKIYNNINPKEWLKNASNMYDVVDTKLPHYMKEKLIKDFSLARSYIQNALFEIDAIDDAKLDKAKKTIEDDISIINKILTSLNNEDINTFSYGILDNFGTTIRFPSQYSDIKELRNKGKDIVDSYKKTKFDITAQLKRIKFMHHIVEKFSEIIELFNEEYSRLKKAENIIDFSDMEKYANKILDNPSISILYKNTFKYVFVDEYQDTSPIQEAIIKKISGINNLFCVGDQKQSIYRFRSSEPSLFMDRDKAYKEKLLPGQVIALNNNFRSSKNILDCANDVFFNISKQSNEITYDNEAALIHGRDDNKDIKPVEIKLIPDKLKDEFEMISSDEIEVFNIIDIINEKMKNKIYDHEIKDYRDVKYSDIVILCRKLPGISDYFVKIFTDNKIPFIIEKSGGLLNTLEVQNLMNILELSNNIDNDLAIISFIHEGFLNFNDDDLIYIRKENYDNSLSENIKTISENSSDLGIKCKKFLDFFKSIKQKERYLGVNDIINHIISQINYVDYYAISQNGKQRVANIKLFQQYAFNYDQKHNDKIFGFINYVNELKNTQIIIDEAKVNYDENSIRITTIHKSKGLEYPIVILPFMGKAFSSIDKRININVERDLGLGFKYFNLEKEEKGKTFIRTLIDNTISEKSKEEEMRLLYVAMTRAKEELIIQGNMSGTKTRSSLLDASCMFDWIMSTIIDEKAEDIFESDKTSSKLNGNWKIDIIQKENIEDYVDKKIEPVDNTSFLSRYALPFISKEEENIQLIDRNIPTAISASKILKEEDNPFKEPLFISRKKSANIGTITHDFLKYVDFKGDLSYFGLLEQKDDMVEKSLIKKEDADLIDFIKLEKFFETKEAKMIIEADELQRERNISVIENADNVGFYSMNTKKILIRCILDLMFKKDGKWYLVDYKTDKINDETDDNELTSKILFHRTQLALYEKAIKEIYGITVEDIYIVFLDIGKAFKIFKYD